MKIKRKDNKLEIISDSNEQMDKIYSYLSKVDFFTEGDMFEFHFQSDHDTYLESYQSKEVE